MRDRLAYLGALLIAACASAPGSLRIPESTLPLDRSPPALARPPEEGAPDSLTSRFLQLTILTGESGTQSTALSGWCRVGVWTTLDRTAARGFVLRESWGRLGERPPRLLARIEDDLIEGITARLRPEEDGSLSFQIEIAETHLLPPRVLGIYHGQRVLLAPPRRHGYRFSGHAPAELQGTIASWLPGVVVRMGDGKAPEVAGGVRGHSRATRMSVSGSVVTVVGEEPFAETFIEEWNPRRPLHIVEDGVERMDFRLVKERRGAGFAPDGHGGLKSYGAAFEPVTGSSVASERVTDE